MSKKDKLLKRMRENPRHVKYDDLQKVLIDLGYTIRQGTGSHVVFKKKGFCPITIPVRQPFVKPYYVKLVLRIIDETEDLDDCK